MDRPSRPYRIVPSARSALLLALLLTALASRPALAAAGDLDTSFSTDGKTTVNFTSRNDSGWAAAVDGSNRVVVAGEAAGVGYRFAIARFNADGTLDTTFGGDGKVLTDFTPQYDGAWGVAIQADGKIVAAGDAGIGSGNSSFAVARYNDDGTLDGSFSGDGKVRIQFTAKNDPVAGLALDADGDIVVSGGAATSSANPRLAVARLNPNGSPDATFSRDGKVMTDLSSAAVSDYANAVVVQTDGRIVAGGLSGERFVVVRYDENGTLDTTFGGDGKVFTNLTSDQDTIHGLAIQSGGRIVAAGIAGGGGPDPGFALARYNPVNGALDTTFSGDGKVITQFTSGWDAPNGVTVQADDSIVAAGGAAGSGFRFAVARYTPNGVLDTSFGGDGKVTTNFTAREDYSRGVDIDGDGNVVVAGYAAYAEGGNAVFAVARYQGS